ncbi:HAD family hydrolase [Actinacidiphila rubida]|uniref:Phosphoglycolate phosphatase, HAD superfamily n=1 Tax=Actinacidiphila rubida TaxID=310780 RepID=A0A1H8Q5C6_9ACTN|nr:haloacid dehalogenase-like hydrolase [Actinacidiphila rubida]SEO49429.1 Phosphoglycolate phosphatase, HAD superfamily [Actinacidiphila rubida]
MALIVLWDIDHTLIDNAGVSKEIYATAYETVTGRAPERAAVTEGRTDRLIMQEMFRRNGVTMPPWRGIEAALMDAGAQRRGALRERGRVLPGVHDVLKATAAEPSWVSSVLTGNIAANARVKLGAFGLDSLVDLAVGAYGADADDRPHLVDVARRRIEAQHRVPAGTPIVLVGDTPRDVEAALASSARIIAVATGVDTSAALTAAGATVVLPDLAETDHVLRLLEDFQRI